MIRSLWSAASGMLAQQLNVDTIAHNLANVNTVGFKRSRVEFEDLFYETIRPAGAPTALGAVLPLGLEVGHGVRPVATQRIFSAGNLQRTDQPLDLAVQGDGFFMLGLGDDRVGYTRAGSFHVDAEGRIVSGAGYPLLAAGGSGDFRLPRGATDITIGPDGRVTAMEPGARSPTELGRIGLARFANPGGLEARGETIFAPTPASGEAQVGNPGEEGFGTLLQGTLEMSNVSVVEEMVSLIMAQRAYEINTKAVQSADEMLAQANNLRR